MLLKYRLHNQICQTIKHYIIFLNKTVTSTAIKTLIGITQYQKSAAKVLKSTRSLAFTYPILLLIAIFIASGCEAAPEPNREESPTQVPTVAIVSNAIPTATRFPTAVSSTQPMARSTAESTDKPVVHSSLPTPTPTPSIYPTSPLATPSPTSSLLAILTQTVIVGDQQPFSTTAFVYLPWISVPLSSTAVITHPTPPIAVQPILGPLPTTTTTALSTTVYLASTLRDLQPDGTTRQGSIPILMYHYLGTPPANADIYRRDLSVAPDLFAAQLDRLQDEGYAVISLYDLAAHLLQGSTLPEKPVVLSFDDGYRDNYENAYPLLRERQMNATFFIVTDFIDRERPEYLTWDMVREMYAGGMSIEVHGVDHTTLRGRSQADLEYQALRSYETIQDRIGIRPRFLSYPAGEFDSKAIEIFRSANYWAAVTTIQGVTQSSDKRFELQRIRIRGTTTPDDLIRLLEAEW